VLAGTAPCPTADGDLTVSEGELVIPHADLTNGMHCKYTIRPVAKTGASLISLGIAAKGLNDDDLHVPFRETSSRSLICLHAGNRSKRSENTEGITQRWSRRRMKSIQKNISRLVGATDEQFIAVALGDACWVLHESERVARAGHGLEGSLAPVVGHQRRVVHRVHGDADIPSLAAEGHPHTSALDLDRADENGRLVVALSGPTQKSRYFRRSESGEFVDGIFVLQQFIFFFVSPPPYFYIFHCTLRMILFPLFVFCG